MNGALFTDWVPTDLLPGAWLLLCAVALALLLRRFYDPVPGRVWAAFAAAILVLLGPALVGGRSMVPFDGLRGSAPFAGLAPSATPGNPLQGDLLLLVAPAQAQARSAFGRGEWPLWSPRTGAGMPLLADPQAQVLQPLVLFGAVLPLAAAAGFTDGLRMLLALVFMFLLLRRQGLASGAALCGALGYGLGGFLLLWLGWPIANPAALLPMLLYAALLCARRGARRDALLLLSALCGVLVGGQPEAIAYALGLLVVFVAALTREARGQRRRFLVTVTGTALLAIGLAAPALLPAVEYLPQSLRAASLRDGAASGNAVAAAHESAVEHLARRWLPIAAPNAYGNGRYEDSASGHAYWGLDNIHEDASGFFGTPLLLAALLGLLARSRRPQERLLWVVLAAALVVLAQPGPLVRALDGLPALLRSPSHHRRLLLLVNFCGAYLGACEIDRRMRGEGRRAPLVALAAALALLLVWAYRAHPSPVDPTILATLREGWLRFQLKALLLAALALAWGLRERWGAAALALVVAAELVTAHAPMNPPSPRRLVSPASAAIDFLHQHLGAQRMAALGPAFRPNLAALFGLPDARVYNPVEPEVYEQLTAPLLARPRRNVPEFALADDPVLDLLAVRYVLTEPDSTVPGLRLVFADETARIWERSHALPLLFLPTAARPAEAASRPRGLVDFAAVSLTEPSVGPALPWAARDAAMSALTVTAWGAAHLRATSRLVETRLLATSLYQDGGWRVLADGMPLPPLRTNGGLVGGWLPAEARQLDLLYRAPGLFAGALWAALATASALAVFGAPPGRLRAALRYTEPTPRLHGPP